MYIYICIYIHIYVIFLAEICGDAARAFCSTALFKLEGPKTAVGSLKFKQTPRSRQGTKSTSIRCEKKRTITKRKSSSFILWL